MRPLAFLFVALAAGLAACVSDGPRPPWLRADASAIGRIVSSQPSSYFVGDQAMDARVVEFELVSPRGGSIRFFTDNSSCPAEGGGEQLFLVFLRRQHLTFYLPGRTHAEVNRAAPRTDFVALSCAPIDVEPTRSFGFTAAP